MKNVNKNVSKPPKKWLKAAFGEKIPMARRRKVLAFCLWLNRAGKDVIFARFNLVIFEIPLSNVKPGTSPRTCRRMSRAKWRMKCTQSSTNFEAFQSFPGHSCILITTAKEIAMYNGKLVPKTEPGAVTFFSA